ncbi:hypothetical protein [Actinomadura sp. RB99]|uniref:hypothetical protein n=1 Tax=Actinomadura sp. RB99 TaxID=2691577 RepID=UPI001681E2EB|nr:hypothetical protein [Actinomadura sp. RB99]
MLRRSRARPGHTSPTGTTRLPRRRESPTAALHLAGTREVMIFDRWTGRARAAFWVYQQRRGYGTDHLVRPARLTGDGRHVACHPRGLRDDPVG